MPRRPNPHRHARSRTVVVGVVLAGVAAAGLAGCGHSNNGLGRLTVDGQVQVATSGSASASASATVSHSARTGDILHAGDRVEVIAGDAAIRLLSGGVLQLRMGTHLTMDKTPRLTGGDVLIEPSDHPLQVSVLDAMLVVPSGVAKLGVGSIAEGLTAYVYQATSQLDIVGNPPAPIAAPRQLSLTPETRLPAQAVPLQYQDTDSWDHLYLAEAETMSSQLAAAAAGFNAQLPANQTKSAAFYLQLLPDLSSQLDFAAAFSRVEGQQPKGAAGAMPGDYLIASVIALRGTHGTFESRLSDEVAFFSQGAPWGFVAYDQGVKDLNGVLNDVLAAIGRAALPFTGAPASQIAIGPPPTLPGSTTTTRPRLPTTTTTTPRATGQPRRPTPTTTAPPTTTPPFLHLPVPLLPGPLGAILNPLLDPLIQALNRILSGKP